MTTTTTAWISSPSKTVRTRAAVTGAIAAVGSVAAVLAVAEIGKAAGAAEVHELTIPALSSLTVVGVLIATVAWD